MTKRLTKAERIAAAQAEIDAARVAKEAVQSAIQGMMGDALAMGRGFAACVDRVRAIMDNATTGDNGTLHADIANAKREYFSAEWHLYRASAGLPVADETAEDMRSALDLIQGFASHKASAVSVIKRKVGQRTKDQDDALNRIGVRWVSIYDKAGYVPSGGKKAGGRPPANPTNPTNLTNPTNPTTTTAPAPSGLDITHAPIKDRLPTATTARQGAEYLANLASAMALLLEKSGLDHSKPLAAFVATTIRGANKLRDSFANGAAE